MNARKFAVELDVLRRPRLDLLPDDGVAGLAGGGSLGRLGGRRDRRVDVLDRDRPLGVDVELSQVGDEHARVLAGHVAEDHVALRLARSALEVDQVADRPECPRAGRARARTGRPGPRSACGPSAGSVRWAVLTDYHVHLRPDDLDATADELLHRGERRALPRGRPRGRDRRARRLRAHPPLHRGARDLGPPVLARERARRPRRLLRVRPHDAAAARDRDGLRPRPRGPDRRRCSTRTTSTTWSARSTSSATARSTTTTTTSGTRDGDPDTALAALLRDDRRGGAHRPLRHPRPPRPGQDLGHERPRPDRDPRFHYEPAIEAIAETGIAVEVSTAGWRKPVDELYPADAFAEMCVDAGAALRALLRRPRARGHRPRVRAGGRDDARLGDRRDRRLRGAASARMEPLG